MTLDEVEDGARVALTTNYLKVALPDAEVPPNRLVDVWVGRACRASSSDTPRARRRSRAAVSVV